MRTVAASKSRSVHLRLWASPVLAPVSLRSWWKVDVLGPQTAGTAIPRASLSESAAQKTLLKKTPRFKHASIQIRFSKVLVGSHVYVSKIISQVINVKRSYFQKRSRES